MFIDVARSLGCRFQGDVPATAQPQRQLPAPAQLIIDPCSSNAANGLDPGWVRCVGARTGDDEVRPRSAPPRLPVGSRRGASSRYSSRSNARSENAARSAVSSSASPPLSRSTSLISRIATLGLGISRPQKGATVAGITCRSAAMQAIRGAEKRRNRVPDVERNQGRFGRRSLPLSTESSGAVCSDFLHRRPPGATDYRVLVDLRSLV